MEKIEVKKPEVVIIGGSAGSLEILLEIISCISSKSTIVYVIIIHRKRDGDSILVELLKSRTSRPVKEVEDKDLILPGHVYLAPPDYHLLFENKNFFSLDYSEKIHFSRPSIDVSFESSAYIFQDKVLGILLSGANEDGAYGLKMIKNAGGRVVVQEPDSADASYMPQKALEILKPDFQITPSNAVESLRQYL